MASEALFIGEKINRLQVIPLATPYYSFYEVPALNPLNNPIPEAKEIIFRLAGKDADGRCIYEQVSNRSDGAPGEREAG